MGKLLLLLKKLIKHQLKFFVAWILQLAGYAAFLKDQTILRLSVLLSHVLRVKLRKDEIPFRIDKVPRLNWVMANSA